MLPTDIRPRTIWSVVALFVLVTALASSAALAQSGPGGGTVSVLVLDAQSGKTLVARTTLRGPVTVVDVSGGNGETSFSDVPEGAYVVSVARAAYRTITSEDFDVAAGHVTGITVRLVRISQLRVIGSVRVRTSSPADTALLNGRSTAVRLAPTLAEALGAIPGVDQHGDDTPAGGQLVSLEGHPAGQTGLTLDGVPLGGPGSSVNLSSLDSGLFSSASVSFASSARAAAGTVSFRTLEPTGTWQGRLTTAYGSFDRGATTASLSGSAGNLGIAVLATSRTTPSLANGLHFMDRSGLDYDHSGENRSWGDLLKLRYRTGTTTFATTLLRSSRESDLLCLQDSAALPCGYGPGNGVRSAFSLSSLSATSLIGGAVVQVTAYAQGSHVVANLLDRTIAGVPAPFLEEVTSRTNGTFAVVQLAAGKHDLTLRYDANRSHTRGDGGPLGALASFGVDRSFADLSLGDRIRLAPTATVGLSVDTTRATGLPRGLLGSVSANWRPTPPQNVALRMDFGNIVTPDGRSGVLTDPSSLNYDCGAHLATGYVPGDAAVPSSLSSVRLGWDTSSANGSIGVQAHVETQRNGVYNALLSAAALPDALFAPGYFTAVGNAARAPGLCGAGSALARAGVYLYTPIAGSTLRYSSLRVGGSLRLRSHVTVEPALELLRATLESADPRLADPRNVTRPGQQLIGVPVLRASLYATYRPNEERGVQVLFGSSYVGRNNPANLPAHVLIDAGVSRALTYGTLTVAVRNVFDTYAGTFTSSRNAVPYTDGNGTSLGTLARPNTPRQIIVTYDIAVGRGAHAAAADLRGDGGIAAGTAGTLVPGMLVTRLPAAVPPDLYERNGGAACTHEYDALAGPVVSALRGWFAQPGVHGLTAPFPAQPPLAPPAFDGVTTTYVPSGKTFSLVFTTSRIDFAQGLASCVHLNVGSPQEGSERGLFVPAAASFVEATVAFSPAVGFYVINVPPPSGALQKFRTFALPAAAPQHPFRLQPESICSGTARASATRYLAELETYFDPPPAAAGATASWAIAPGGTGTARWYSLRSNAIAAVASVLNCAYVAGGTRAGLAGRGLGGLTLPVLNFAPGLGLYVVTETPPDGTPKP